MTFIVTLLPSHALSCLFLLPPLVRCLVLCLACGEWLHQVGLGSEREVVPKKEVKEEDPSGVDEEVSKLANDRVITLDGEKVCLWQNNKILTSRKSESNSFCMVSKVW